VHSLPPPLFMGVPIEVVLLKDIHGFSFHFEAQFFIMMLAALVASLSIFSYAAFF